MPGGMTPQQIAEQVERAAGKGLKAAAIWLRDRAKETLSEPAPKVRVRSKLGIYYYETSADGLTVRKMRAPAGTWYYRATVNASPGKPPRKLSGRLRASIAFEVSDDGKTARVGTLIPYGKTHEEGNHQFLLPTLQRELGNIQTIIGREASA